MKHRYALSGMAARPRHPIFRLLDFEDANKEKTMSIQEMRNRSRAGQLGRGMIVAAAIAAVSIAATPTTAHARGGIGPGAAIGLGVLGGVLAGAAIAATAPPVYGAPPPPAYYYPPPPYQSYYGPAPGYYYPSQQYYGWTPYQ